MIVANLATYPQRHKSLSQVVATISPQVDRLNIVLNQYEVTPPEFENYSNVFAYIPDSDIKDLGKFMPDVKNAEYVFLIDDDIIYPTNYVDESVRQFESLKLENYIGGYHGSLYLKPSLRQFITSPSLLFNYKNRIADFRSLNFGFFHELREATVVDQIGTGTAILRAKDMPSFEYMRTSIKYVDVRFARWCYERGIAPVCLPRAAHWLETLSNENSIYSSFTTQNHPYVNAEILSYAFKVRFRGVPANRI